MFWVTMHLAFCRINGLLVVEKPVRQELFVYD